MFVAAIIFPENRITISATPGIIWLFIIHHLHKVTFFIGLSYSEPVTHAKIKTIAIKASAVMGSIKIRALITQSYSDITDRGISHASRITISDLTVRLIYPVITLMQ